jgi:hypothetical protein
LRPFFRLGAEGELAVYYTQTSYIAHRMTNYHCGNATIRTIQSPGLGCLGGAARWMLILVVEVSARILVVVAETLVPIRFGSWPYFSSLSY